MTDDPDAPVWLTAAETAEYLKVSTRHLQRLRAPGENGPPFHGVGRRLRYDRREVDDWMRRGGGAPHPLGWAIMRLHGDPPDPHPYPEDSTLDNDPNQTGK